MQGIGVGVEVKRGNKKYGHLQAFGAKRRQESEVQVESSCEDERGKSRNLLALNSKVLIHF